MIYWAMAVLTTLRPDIDFCIYKQVSVAEESFHHDSTRRVSLNGLKILQCSVHLNYRDMVKQRKRELT